MEFLKSLHLESKVLGEEQPSVATTRSNIALVYHAQRNYKKALEEHKAALSIREHSLAADHSSTQSSRRNVALVESLMQRDESCRERDTQAFSIQRKEISDCLKILNARKKEEL